MKQVTAVHSTDKRVEQLRRAIHDFISEYVSSGKLDDDHETVAVVLAALEVQAEIMKNALKQFYDCSVSKTLDDDFTGKMQ